MAKHEKEQQAEEQSENGTMLEDLMGYFATNAVLGLGASSLSDQVNSELSEEQKGKGFPVTADVAGNIMLEAALTFEQDYDAVAAGEYKMPWDMVTLSHRQYSPCFPLPQPAAR